MDPADVPATPNYRFRVRGLDYAFLAESAVIYGRGARRGARKGEPVLLSPVHCLPVVVKPGGGTANVERRVEERAVREGLSGEGEADSRVDLVEGGGQLLRELLEGLENHLFRIIHARTRKLMPVDDFLRHPERFLLPGQTGREKLGTNPDP